MRVRVAGLGDGALRDDDGDDRERQVDQEDPAPAGVLHQEAAQERTDGGGDAAETGPGADRLGAVVADERPLDHRQAAGREQGSAHALEDAGRDQHLGGRRDAAQERCEREPDRPDHEDPASTEPVAERAAEQDEAGEREQVAVGDPLQLGQRRVEVLTDGVQGHVHDGAVQHRHARPENGREHDRPPGRRTEANAHQSGSVAHSEETRRRSGRILMKTVIRPD